jgi:hypothetical protein
VGRIWTGGDGESVRCEVCLFGHEFEMDFATEDGPEETYCGHGALLDIDCSE